MLKNNCLYALILPGAIAALGIPAHAQVQRPYPSKPIRLIVGFPPGGNADAASRLTAQRMGDAMGVNVVVENRGGAGGSVAAQIAARAPNDGYTLLWSSPGALTVNRVLEHKLPYDPDTAFHAVGRTFTFCNVLVVRGDSTITTLAQYLALAREKPGHLQYASQGVGAAGHLAGQLLQNLSGVRLHHIPFKGATEILTSVVGGDMASAFVSIAAATGMRTRLRALAVSSAQRDPAMPDIPSMPELGVKGYDATFWFGVMVPSGTPGTIITRLNKELRVALEDAEVVRYARSQGLNPAPSSPQEFAAVIKGDYEKWKRVMLKP